MDGTESVKRPEPKPMIDLLPGLSGIFQSQAFKNDIKSFVDMQQNRTTEAIPSTVEKAYKPRPFNALTPFLTALNQPMPAKAVQSNNSTKRKNWNSSVKVNKTVNHTSNKQLAHSSVRKVLKFIPKPKPIEPVNKESPKFVKPRPSTKQTQLQGKVNSRISGVTNITETPATQYDSKFKKRTTISNKENVSKIVNKDAKSCPTSVITPKITHKILSRTVIESPLLNESWKSSGDASFLQTEKEIQDTVNAINTLSVGQMLEETLNGRKPLVSTPLKDYRQDTEPFKNTENTGNSICKNNETIRSFDNINKWREDNKRDEKVDSCCEISWTLEDLLEIKKETEHNIEMTEHTLNSLKNMAESQMKFLDQLKNLINAKMTVKAENESIDLNKTEVKKEISEPVPSSSSRHCSVITSCSKSPSYKIPKKSAWSRNKIYHKSMPNIYNGIQISERHESNKALNVYMQMKEQLEFLKTPERKCNKIDTLNTPTVTSHNLQTQLDKLYNNS